MTWREIIKIRRRYERQYRKVIYNDLISELHDVLKELNISNVLYFDYKISGLPGNKYLKKSFYELYKDTGWDFYQAVKNRKSFERSLWDESFTSYIEISVGMKITWIDGYTKEKLMQTAKEVIKIGNERGLGTYEMERLMRRMLTNEYTKFSKARALRIVQTEVMSASNLSTLYAGNNSGLVMRKVWLTAPFGISKTERHNLYPELKEQRPMKGDKFRFSIYEMEGPGDPAGGPENTINCKCALAWEQLEI